MVWALRVASPLHLPDCGEDVKGLGSGARTVGEHEVEHVTKADISQQIRTVLSAGDS